MYLYHLTVQNPTHIPFAVTGSFTSDTSDTSDNGHEIVLIRGTSRIEILKLDTATGRLTSLLVSNLFCTIRSLATLRMPGDKRDYLVLGSDAGRIVILEWQEGGGWTKVHQETFGRSGVRRTGAGEWVAADPQGRAIMMAAIEKQKLVYVMNRDPSTNQLTISSPLECNKSNVVVFSLVSVDVGYDNPLFAAIEVDTTPAIVEEVNLTRDLERLVTFYEVDLGLNHVTRKWSEPVNGSANLLVGLPAGEEGPGGVLVCHAGGVSWHKLGYASVGMVLPKRIDPLCATPKRDVIIISGVVVKTKEGFFLLLQSEEGDLFRVDVRHEKGMVTLMDVRYFDTIPVASTMQLFRPGFLFIGSEWSSHRLYQIQSLGDDAPHQVHFTPRSLSNLVLVDRLENYAEMTDGRVMNLGEEEIPQLYTIQGRAQHSTFNVMRPGLHVTEVAASELPANPTGIWTLKQSLTDQHDSYIVVSFGNSTVVLHVGDTVEEATDTGFIPSVQCVSVGQLDDGSFIQVYPNGVRQIRPDRRENEWTCPPGRVITKAAVNSRQVIISLSDNSLVYFEADLTGILLERKMISEMPEAVTSVALGPVPNGRQRSRFLAVGSADMTVRMLSCDPDDCLEPLSLQALAALPTCLMISELGGDDSMLGALILDVGLENGVHARLRLDGTNGALTDARTRYLGNAPVSFSNASTEATGKSALLAMSTRPWLGYVLRGQSHLVPLALPMVSAAAPFSSEQCPAGIVVLTESTLRIVMVESLEDRLTRQSIPLDHTPRRMVYHPASNLFAIIESDYRGYSPDQRTKIEFTWKGGEDQEWTHLSFKGKWNSTVRLISPSTGTTTAVHHFEDNETTTWVNELYLAVGIAKDMSITPRYAPSSSILLFLIDPTKGTFTLTHRTLLDSIPSCLASFGGRLLAGVGSALRLYDIGKKQLLRKCEARLPSFATCIQTQGWRIVIGDAEASVLLFHYQTADNRFQLIADDTQQRPITALLMLDYETIAVADRFGSFSVLRLPTSVGEDLDNEATAGAVAAKREHLYGAPFKLERLAEFYLGDTITSLSKAALSYGSREVLLYTTISGAVGIFLPFTSRDEALLFQTLETTLRQEPSLSLAGRDHLLYRSYYAAVKAIMDGDLCEMITNLPGDRMHFVTSAVDRAPAELLKQIQDMRITAGM